MNSTINDYSPNVIIKNLPSKISKHTILNTFDKFGKLNKIILNKNIATLTYSNIKDGYAAIKALNNTIFEGNKITVQIYEDTKLINKKLNNINFSNFFKCNLFLFFINIILLCINIAVIVFKIDFSIV
jgi:RNA recognition motif-containing protein